jgi:hypothetical protein
MNALELLQSMGWFGRTIFPLIQMASNWNYIQSHCSLQIVSYINPFQSILCFTRIGVLLLLLPLPLFPASDRSCDPRPSLMSVTMTMGMDDQAQQRSSLFCIVEPVLFISLSSPSSFSLSLPSSTFAHSHFIPCQPPLKSLPKPPKPLKRFVLFTPKGTHPQGFLCTIVTSYRTIRPLKRLTDSSTG